MGTPQKGAGRNLVLSRAGWENIRAVRSGRVYDKLSTDVITRPGPRVLEGIEELRNCIRGKMHFSQEMQKARNSNIEIRDNRK